MDWIQSLFNIHSSVQAIVIVSLICAVGLWMGKAKIGNVSLGVAFVFFIGILVGNFQLDIDQQMLDYCETFGLVLFVFIMIINLVLSRIMKKGAEDGSK